MVTDRRQTERETRILHAALEALTRTTGLKAKIIARQPKLARDMRPDAAIVVENAGKQHRYLAEIKVADRIVPLNQVNQQLRKYRKQGVFITPYLTTELANYCREIGLQFIDTAGNVYLRGRGMFIHVRGERPLAPYRNVTAPRGGGTATALRVIFALLCKPQLLNAPYRDIVEAAGVALGAVGWVFFDLERRGLVIGGKKKGNRRFVDPTRLMHEWVANYPIKLRPKVLIQKFAAARTDWWQTAELQAYDGIWGGEVAADRITGNREPGTFTIYLQGDPVKLVLKNRLRADPNGNIELLRKFWHFDNEDHNATDVTPPLLIYADLMATHDPRNHETAKRIHDQFLTNAYGKV